MKKFYILTMLLFCSIFSFGQMRAVSQKIQELSSKHQTFKNYDLFSENDDAHKSGKYLKSASDVSILNLNQLQLQKLVADKPETLSFTVPYNGVDVNVNLYKDNILADDFTARNEKGQTINYTPGVYYKGIIGNDMTSLVAFSFFEGNIMGIASSPEFGNLVLGKSKDKQDFVVYSDKNLIGQNPFVCGVDELPENQKHNISFDNDMMSKAQMTENCVRIYYEVAYAPYLQNGSDETETLDWLTGVHNNIATLYTNDDVKVALSEVMIWTSDDPYDGDYGENLDEFRQTRTVFNGDLGHLINYPATTSVAYLNSICTDFRYAYSGIDMFYEEVPTYSWTIMAMTHEMGHSMGSPHTHACAWNGNNTAIDGCGPWAGYSEGCDGDLPTGGGTIMSYCHLTPVGINLSDGFGPQPAALIRNTVDSKLCLGTDCVSSCIPTVEGLELNFNVSGAQLEVSIIDDTSDSWSYAVYQYGTTPGEWINTTDPVFDISGLQENVYYELMVGNVCENGIYGNVVKRLILLGDYCDGETFTDTGGTNGNYGDDQVLIKTFYPSSPDEKVKLTFTDFDLEQDYDFMYVYNGSSVDAPVFANGNQLSGSSIPGPFASTAADGAITIKFVSDSYVTEDGWEANVNCASLGIEDFGSSEGVNVYPNPASDVVNVEAQKEIKSIKLNDTSGKLILNKKSNSFQEKINIHHLPKGVYILTIEMKGQKVIKKIIKN